MTSCGRQPPFVFEEQWAFEQKGPREGDSDCRPVVLRQAYSISTHTWHTPMRSPGDPLPTLTTTKSGGAMTHLPHYIYHTTRFTEMIRFCNSNLDLRTSCFLLRGEGDPYASEQLYKEFPSDKRVLLPITHACNDPGDWHTVTACITDFVLNHNIAPIPEA